MSQVDVVLANNDRVTLRVGDTFLKIDADQQRTDREVDAIRLAPVPTPEILWRKSPVLALAALPGRTLGRLGAVHCVADSMGRRGQDDPDAARRTTPSMAWNKCRRAVISAG